MSAWLAELRHALDASPHAVAFFFRTDDAGWSDDRLLELLDLFARYSLPINIAAIPIALTFSIAAELRSRIEAEPDRVAIHQHGFSHQNHESVGRKCEFGAARAAALQQSDIESGKKRLFDLIGPRVSPVFTPPWNRCTSVTGECLRRAGLHILSRDATAAPLNLDGLYELPVTIDWFARRKGVRLSQHELGEALAASVRTSDPVGIMFHHALMDADEQRRAGELLALLASHQNAQCYLMERIITELSQDITAQVKGHAAGWRPSVMPSPAQPERK
ncbi:MAG TPA: hypothetical protein VM911_21895 [Pyrinomonadaceae bacterium]|jgi:peptidoglycan/xylan/chitin deacetylase (PgdA/CDA1 family)|nr:hypothetical protein [Pyrinomonadaceae bacterium]